MLVLKHAHFTQHDDFLNRGDRNIFTMVIHNVYMLFVVVFVYFLLQNPAEFCKWGTYLPYFLET